MIDLYRHFSADGELLYVGISLNAMARFHVHRRVAEWRDLVATITIEKFKTRAAAEKAERAAIRKEGPKFNKARYALKSPKKKKAKKHRKKFAAQQGQPTLPYPPKLMLMMEDNRRIAEISSKLSGAKLDEFLAGNYNEMKANGFKGFL